MYVCIYIFSTPSSYMEPSFGAPPHSFRRPEAYSVRTSAHPRPRRRCFGRRKFSESGLYKDVGKESKVAHDRVCRVSTLGIVITVLRTYSRWVLVSL